MSEHVAPPALPRFRSETCPTCTREVLVDTYHEGPTPQCEFCAGAAVGLHQRMKEEREERQREALEGASEAFMVRVGNVARRAHPDPHRRDSLGRCPYCDAPFVLLSGRIAHAPIPCMKKESK